MVVPPAKSQQDLGLWTATGATDISGHRAVLPAWAGCEKGTGDCPRAGRSEPLFSSGARLLIVPIGGFSPILDLKPNSLDFHSVFNMPRRQSFPH